LIQEPAPLHEDVERIAKDLPVGHFLGKFVIATRLYLKRLNGKTS
jgi:hypothetical protein